GVVAESGHQAGAQPEPGGRGGEVGDPAGAGAHALGPQLLAGPGQALDAGEDDVEEDGARQQHVQRRVLGGALGGKRVPGVACGAAGGVGRGRGAGAGGASCAGARGPISGHLTTPSGIPRMTWRGRKWNRLAVGRATTTTPADSSAVSEVYWP